MIGWFYLFFFLSGLTALIYETAFAHQLHLIFGSTLSAVTLVLAVYLGGMALGAAILGPRADRHNPLRLYGILEIGIGITAIVAVILIPMIRYIYAHFSGFLGTQGVFAFIFQALLAVIFLLPSTFLMGATLPALSKGVTTRIEKRFSRISALYGLNTFGAALGTLLCGFLLLENLGYFGSVSIAMLANLLIGFVALRLAKKLTVSEAIPAVTSDTVEAEAAPIPGNEKSDKLRKLVLILAAISGLAALGYEVIWFRILTFSVVTDAYAFALMLGIYLLGIGAGSLVGSRRFRKKEGADWEKKSAWLELGVLELLVSVLVVAGFAALIWINEQLGRPTVADPGFWLKTLRNTSLQAVVLIFPVTFLLGYIFPMMISLYSANLGKLGGQVGWVSALNTTGAIVGIVISGFVLIPWIGIQYSLFLMALLSVLVGITALVLGPIARTRRMMAILVGVPACIIALVLFPMRVNFGFQQIPTHANAELLFYKESGDQTVIVVEDKGGRKVRRLLLNQQQATSTGMAGQRKNQLLGHLPLWACPEAEKAMVICFGSGGTFGALGLYDLERVDCVEICPSVIEAAHLFNDWNGEVLARENARVVIDDGRSYLLTAPDRYDVITLEPMHPGLKGVSSLYSREFYEEARNRLNPGGVICQWVPLYSMTGEDARSLIATAVEVFPQSSLWIVGTEGILLCARDTLHLDAGRMEACFEDKRTRAALQRVLLDDPWAILSGFLLGPEGLQAYTADAPIMRDNRPFTEFTIPRHQHLDPWDDIIRLGRMRESPLKILRGLSDSELQTYETRWEENKQVWIERDRGFAAYQQGDFKDARIHVEEAFAGNPEDRYAAYFLKEIYWRYGVEFGKRKQWQQAIDAYRRATQIDPADPEAHLYLAIALETAGQIQLSVEAVREALKLRPEYPAAAELLARIERSF
jgi:spermidine synthase